MNDPLIPPAPETSDTEPPRAPPAPELSDARNAPPPEVVAAVTRHFVELRQEHEQKVREIEAYLGFVATSDDLTVRIAKIELFLGVK